MKLGTYRHFKGNMYQVLGTARHSETLEELVVYKALYDSKEFGPDSLWVRSKEMFLEKIVRNGKSIKRFEFMKEQ